MARFTDSFNANGISIDTINSTSNGLFANTTQMSFGNATVNAVLTCGTFTLGGGISDVGPGNRGLYISSSIIELGNSTVNATINSTAFTGVATSALTANDVTNVGGVPSSNVVSNAQLSGNLTTYSTTNFAVVNTAGNGTFALPGGWHIAFGSAVANSTGANMSVTFANAFTSNAYSVIVTPVANSTVYARAHANGVTKTGMTMFCGNTTAFNNTGISMVYYMAIGY